MKVTLAKVLAKSISNINNKLFCEQVVLYLTLCPLEATFVVC